MELHDNYQEIYTIERRIYKKGSFTERVKIYLTSRGRMLVYDWLDTPYKAQKNISMKDNINKNLNMISFNSKEPLMQNIEMLSKYLDIKVIFFTF